MQKTLICPHFWFACFRWETGPMPVIELTCRWCYFTSYGAVAPVICWILDWGLITQKLNSWTWPKISFLCIKQKKKPAFVPQKLLPSTLIFAQDLCRTVAGLLMLTYHLKWIDIILLQCCTSNFPFIDDRGKRRPQMLSEDLLVTKNIQPLMTSFYKVKKNKFQ